MRAGGGGAGLDASFDGRLGCGEAFAEAVGVERGDFEDAVTALRASGAAREMRAGALDGRGQGLAEDLEEGFGHGLGRGSGEEWVAEFEGAVLGAVVHVFGVEVGGAGTEGGFNDESVPIADAAELDAGEGELDEGCVDGDDDLLA
jgi:hypothetical protein